MPQIFIDTETRPRIGARWRNSRYLSTKGGLKMRNRQLDATMLVIFANFLCR